MHSACSSVASACSSGGAPGEGRNARHGGLRFTFVENMFSPLSCSTTSLHSGDSRSLCACVGKHGPNLMGKELTSEMSVSGLQTVTLPAAWLRERRSRRRKCSVYSSGSPCASGSSAVNKFWIVNQEWFICCVSQPMAEISPGQSM